MIIQNRDGSFVGDGEPEVNPYIRQRIYAELPAPVVHETSLIERLINYAFDAIGVRHVEVRVLDAE
ncbi:MAG TPA: hypothetical protein VFS21_07660 [Roseiflexaceae bacterium]|nr:hypothetical protein [Roseiflexaceae bacterium]